MGYRVLMWGNNMFLLNFSFVLFLALSLNLSTFPAFEGEAAKSSMGSPVRKRHASPTLDGNNIPTKAGKVESAKGKEKAEAKGTLTAEPQPHTLPKGDSFLKTFESILKQAPAPIEMPVISVENEQAQGSRRFVKPFPSIPATPDSAKWHKASIPFVRSFVQAATIGHTPVLPKEVNVALSRVSFFDSSHNLIESEEIPYFFVSGWPANDPREKLKEFSGSFAIKVKNLGPEKSQYGIHFVTAKYEKGKEIVTRDRAYSPFFKDINLLMNKEKQKEDKVLQDTRIDAHTKLTSPLVVCQTNDIRGKLYFHSEQGMRSVIKDKIQKKKQAPSSQSIAYAIVDICSRYDMCWCCGDVLCSSAHTDDLGLKVFFHVVGEFGYTDRPFNEKGGKALREKRTEFSGYESGKAYEHGPYKPYIAHATLQDL